MSTSKKGISALYLQRQLGLKSYEAAWLMLHKIRQAMLQREDLYQLRGTVQMDAIGVGGKTSPARAFYRQKRGRPFKGKTPFWMAVEETGQGGPRFIRLEALDGITAEAMVPVIEKGIQKGSTLKTDGAAVYRVAAKKGYHLDQSAYSSAPWRTLRHLRWLNLITSNFKRYLLGTYHGVHPKYRKAYGAEFAYRFNRRYWPYEAFDRLVLAGVTAKPKTMSELSR
jgi:hypothetical protein